MIVPGLRQALKQMGDESLAQPQVIDANAYESIETIVDMFGFEGGLGDLAPFWRLNGDQLNGDLAA
ncbi:MAG: hypothetical protein HC805_08025 [Alkalinema sp. RL_2_19]|nr:hypothetical protein [Alkalinema sp. RL_2_19]